MIANNFCGNPHEGGTFTSQSLWHRYLHSLHFNPKNICLLHRLQVVILKFLVKLCGMSWPRVAWTLGAALGVSGDLGTVRLLW